MQCSGLLNNWKLFTSSASPSLRLPYLPPPSLPPALAPADAPRSPDMLLLLMLMLVTDCSIRHGHPLIRPQWVFFPSHTHFSLPLILSPSRSPLQPPPHLHSSSLFFPSFVQFFIIIFFFYERWRITRRKPCAAVEDDAWWVDGNAGKWSLPVFPPHLNAVRVCVRKRKGRQEFRGWASLLPPDQRCNRLRLDGRGESAGGDRGETEGRRGHDWKRVGRLIKCFCRWEHVYLLLMWSMFVLIRVWG